MDQKSEDSKSKYLGKCWAAIRGDYVVAHLPMRVPDSVDFESYKNKSKECLGHLGDVKNGELILRDGKFYFLRRVNHIKRSKQPKPPKEYLVEYLSGRENSSRFK